MSPICREMRVYERTYGVAIRQGRSPCPTSTKRSLVLGGQEPSLLGPFLPDGVSGRIPATAARQFVAKKGPWGSGGVAPSGHSRGFGGVAPASLGPKGRSMRPKGPVNWAFRPHSIHNKRSLSGPKAPYNIARSATGFRRKPRGLRPRISEGYLERSEHFTAI